MQLTLEKRDRDAPALSPEDAQAVLAAARALQREAQAGAIQPLLRGKKLALLSEDDGNADAELFRTAATALGAHVTHLRLSHSRLSTPEEVQHTASVLERLYEAVECQGVPPTLVRQLRRRSGIPVYEGLATPSHTTAQLLPMLEGDASEADKRLFVLQAVLLATLA